MTASTDLQAALHEDGEPIQMLMMPANHFPGINHDELTFQPHHVLDDVMMSASSGSGNSTASSAISKGTALRQDTPEKGSNEAAANTDEKTPSAKEEEADAVGSNWRRGDKDGLVQVLPVCRGCGAPVLSQAAIIKSRKLGRTPNNSPMARAKPQHELTKAFLEKHMVTAMMSQREIIFYHGQSACSVNRAMKKFGIPSPKKRTSTAGG